MGRVAITRGVSPALARCELTHLERSPIDPQRAAAQHAAYEDALAALGCELHRLPADPACPDCVFVEDVAVVLDELAIITRPGAASRRAETPAVAAALAGYRPLAAIEAPGILDGGDVLVAGRRVFVGLTTRTDPAGARQLARFLEPAGYEVTTVPVAGALHLKSAVTEAAPGALLLDPERVDPASFEGFELIPVAAGEEACANTLRVGGTLLVPAGFPETRARLEDRGLDLRAIASDELAKAEGGLSCCSLVFEARPGGATAAEALG